MDDTNAAGTGAPAPKAAAPVATRHVLYRTAAHGGEKQGTVIATMDLISLDGVTAPQGFAFAVDPEGAYPIGSIYAPPAE